EGSAVPGIFIKLQRNLKVGIGDRPAISAPRERRQDTLGTRVFLVGLGRLANENPAPARCIAGALRIVRSVDRDGINGGRDPRMPIHVEMRLVRLAASLEQG